MKANYFKFVPLLALGYMILAIAFGAAAASLSNYLDRHFPKKGDV